MEEIKKYKLHIALFVSMILVIFGGSVLESSHGKPVWNVVSDTLATLTIKANIPAESGLYEYIEVTDSCGPYFDGEPCVNMRSGPGVEYPVVTRLRNGMVLKVASTTVSGGHAWYKIAFDGEVHYPERVKGGWYVVADYVKLFFDAGQSETTKGINATSTKRIMVDLSKQMMYAYEGDTLFMEQPISAGLELTPTAIGTFRIFKKRPDSYMQGPIPDVSDQYYDLPGVPWDLYFTNGGAAIHGTYWHDHFGQPWSHGCVNLPPDQAKILYKWAELGTSVTVQK